MNRFLFAAMPLLCAGLGASAIHAADLSSYRGMKFGTNVSTAAKQAGRRPSEARTLYRRPALIQEMDWQPRSAVLTDPATEGMLSFYNGVLFRIVITYDRYKVEGMTSEDIIEVISKTYGVAARPTVDVAYHSIYGEVAPLLARWEDQEYAYNLVRTGDQSSFAMILYSKGPNALAQEAIAEAVRLDTEEAPRLEQEKQNQLDNERRLSLEKARLSNKPNFRP